VQMLPTGAAMRAAMLFIGGIVLFAWPASQRRVVSAEPQASTSDIAPALAAGAHK
jgi:hypothetical protein